MTSESDTPGSAEDGGGVGRHTKASHGGHGGAGRLETC